MELQYTPIRAQWPDKDSVVTAFRYLLACPFVMGKTVLELGCGSGNGVEILSAHTKEYVGIDIEPHWGKNNSKQNSKVTFIQAEACNIPAEFEGKFDVVIALELVEHLNAPAALCSQIRKVLTPNGLAIISTPNFDLLSRRGKNSGRPLFRHHIREYKTDEFEQYLKNFEMNFCIHGLSQLSRSSDISDNLRIVFNDVLYELKVGQQFPDMEILSKQFLPKSIPLHYSQSFFAIVGSGAGQKRSFISNISQRHPEVVVTKADKSISMEDICAMSVEWILHRRNEHVSDMQDIVGDIQGVVGDRERRIVNFEKNTSDMENVILVLKEQIEQINDSKESEKRAIIKKQKNLIAQKESQLLEATKTIRDTEQKHLEYCTTIEKHIENLENIVKNREEQIEHSKKVITELDCRLKEKDTTIDAKDKTIAEKESQFKTSQETVSIIRNSFSYKTGSFLTFPLRFLYRNIKLLLIESKGVVNYNLKEKLSHLFKSCPREAEAKGLFAVQPKPKVVHLAISRTCNISCIMCPIGRESLQGKKKFLDFETFKKVFGDGKNFEFLNFVGAGEVFVAKDFINILNYCVDKRFSALGCITNFQLISEEMAELMVKNHFQQITVSIDGCTKETFEYIRKGAKFETILRTMDAFCELKKRYNSNTPNFTFSTVAMNSNIHEFPGLVRLAHKYGVGHIYVARLHVSKENILDESLFFHQEKYNRYYDETVDLCEKLGLIIEMPPKFGSPPAEKGKIVRDCRMPFESIYIDVDGVAYPCVCRVDPDVSIGNICEDDLMSIWQSKKFNSFRKAMFSKSPPKQCKECTFSVLDPNKLESHMTPELAQKVKGGNL